MRLAALITVLSPFILSLSALAQPQPAETAALPPSSMLPKMVGERGSVIYVSASTILRWQEEDTVLLHLRGRAYVTQGTDMLRSRELVVWFTELEQNGEKLGVAEVYGEDVLALARDGATMETQGAAIIRFVTSAGLLLTGTQVRAGDASDDEDLLTRAAAFRRGAPLTPIEGLPDGLLGALRPTAEEMSFTELTDLGVVITLHGNARVKSQTLDLVADTIRIRVSFHGGRFQSSQIESIYAEGAVDYTRGPDRMTADTLYLELRAEEGLAIEARLRTIDPETMLPVQFYASRFRQVSRHRFVTEGPGYFTTSRFAKPHYRIQGKEMDMVRGPGLHRLRERREMQAEQEAGQEPKARLHAPESRVVSSRGNVFYIESVPVFYLPYIAKDITTGTFLLKSIETGDTTYLGTYARVEWDLYDLGIFFNEWSELTLRTDYFSERGFGIGLDFVYEFLDRRHGFVRAYHINDMADEDDEDLTSPETTRGEFTVRHREFLSDTLQADVEIGYLSDYLFLRTYDRDEYDEGKDRETILYLRRAVDNTLLTVQARPRINDFQNYLERYGVAYHVIGEPVGRTPLVWTSSTDLSWLQLRFDDDLEVDDPDSVVRLDTAHEISWPFMLGFVRVDPYIWGDVTLFSDQAGGGSATARAAAAFGVRAAANFYRTYDAYSRLFAVDRLRHIITPKLEYEYLTVSDSHSDFIQHDDTDALDDLHRLTLGVRSRLQTYRYLRGTRQPIDFVLFNLDYNAQFRNERADEDLNDFIEASFQWQVTDKLRFVSDDNRYNMDTGEVDSLDAKLVFDYWRPLRLTYEHEYFDTGSISSLRIEHQPLFSRWRVGFETDYNFRGERRPGDKRDPKRLGTEIYFVRFFEDWKVELAIGLNQGRADETTISLIVAPPGSRSGTTIFELQQEGSSR